MDLQQFEKQLIAQLGHTPTVGGRHTLLDLIGYIIALYKILGLG